ncbi:MAG: N-methyl-L-tryptophan oxidase [Fuerstiella sp.]|nr:N-methyl-L-tryptophan oxidase [Fuerstiella sp.]
MNDVDCLVLGLGAMGSATLYHLARLQQNVVGLEQFETGHGFGSSHGHSRAFRVFYHDPLYTELAEAALPLWQELQTVSGESLLHLCGFLGYGGPDCTLFEQNLRAIRRSRAEFEQLTPEDVSSQFPDLQLPKQSMACFTPRAGFLDASRCVRTHLAEARRLGAAVHQQVHVENVEFTGDRPGIVRTSAGDFRADRLVVTAGPWTADVLSELRLPLTVTRQQKFYFRANSPQSPGPTGLPVYADYDTRFYGFPMHGPGIKVADDTRGDTTHPDRIDRTFERATHESLNNWLKALMPKYSFQFHEASTCMYTETPDQDFLIGPHPQHPNILVGGGFSGHGFKFSTLIGLILAQLVVEGSTPWPIARFALNRFG